MNGPDLSNFLLNLVYEDIPRPVIIAAKNCIMDGLGVALAGSTHRAGKIITSSIRELGGKPESSVIGSDFQTSAPDAALANGVMAHILDYDDALIGWGGHVTVAVLPAVLALGEREGKTGKETLTAFIGGWEIGAKIGAIIGPRVADRWHPHAIMGPLAAAVACSKLLNLSGRQTRTAIGIAASDAMGLRKNFGTDTKSLHAGKSARSGVMSALLAKMGFTADQNILEGRLGLAEAYTMVPVDLPNLVEGLGKPFALTVPGVTFKAYPSCGLTQRSINAMLNLVRENDIKAENIAGIECETQPDVPLTLRYPQARTATEGKFSMQYCLAAAVIDGEVTLKQFTDEKVLAPRIQELMGKIKYVHPEGSRAQDEDARGSQRVTVQLKNGKCYSCQVAYAKGESMNAMTPDEITSKFRDCAQKAIAPAAIEQSIQLISALDSLKDIRYLLKLTTLVS